MYKNLHWGEDGGQIILTAISLLKVTTKNTDYIFDDLSIWV